MSYTCKICPKRILAKCAKPHQRVDEVLTIKVDCFAKFPLYCFTLNGDDYGDSQCPKFVLTNCVL